MLKNGRTLSVANVIWCTGYYPGFSWVELPVFAGGEPLHDREVVATEPGLYFVGLKFLYAASSTIVHGVSRDAEYIVQAIMRETRSARTPASVGV